MPVSFETLDVLTSKFSNFLENIEHPGLSHMFSAFQHQGKKGFAILFQDCIAIQSEISSKFQKVAYFRE